MNELDDELGCHVYVVFSSSRVDQKWDMIKYLRKLDILREIVWAAIEVDGMKMFDTYVP